MSVVKTQSQPPYLSPTNTLRHHKREGATPCANATVNMIAKKKEPMKDSSLSFFKKLTQPLLLEAFSLHFFLFDEHAPLTLDTRQQGLAMCVCRQTTIASQ